MTNSVNHSVNPTATQPSLQPLINSSAEVGIIVQSADGHIQACNGAAQQLLGISVEQVHADLFRSDRWQIVQEMKPHNGSIAPLESHPAIAALRTGKAWRGAMIFGQPNGNWVELELSSEPLFAAAQLQEDHAAPYAVITTLTQLRRSPGSTVSAPTVSAPIDSSNHSQTDSPISNPEIDSSVYSRSIPHQLFATLESISDAFFSLDRDWRFTYVNTQAARLLNRSVADLLGKSHWEEFPDTVGTIVEQEYRRALAERVTVSFEIFYPPLDGWFAVRAYPILDEGNGTADPLGLAIYFQNVTEQKQLAAERQQTDAALRQSENRYRMLFESIDDGFCILEVLFDADDRPIDYRFLEINPTFEQQTGLKDAVGKTILELIPNIEHHWIETYGKIALTGEALRFEEHSEVMNRWFDVYAFRVDQPESRRVALLFKDITERKRKDAALQDSETRFRRMTDVLPQIMWTANPNGTIDYYNQYWEDYTGASRVGTDDWEWRDIVHPEDVPKTIECWSQAFMLELSLYECEHRVRRKDGEYRWHLTRAVPYRDDQGQIIKWFGLAIDIHEQKLAMEARERYAKQTDRLLQQEQIARAEAERANQVKDEFLAVLSHELRSPLNPILGWAKLLQSARLSPAKTIEGLKAIERNAKLQTQLIDDLLDISRIMRGKLILNYEPTNLAAVISAAAETVHLAAEAKQIQLNLQLDPNVQPVDGDAGRLQQVLWNLLSNAVKFTPSGGRVLVKLEQRERGAEEQGAEERGAEEQRSNLPIHSSTHPLRFAQITITDTGKGISPDFLPFLFDYFRQEDGSITRRFGGLGLGLSIARQVVEMHGGTISAESAGENEGATFTVRLPLLKSRGAGEQGSRGDYPSISSMESTTKDQPPTLLLEGVRVLVVDDDADTRELLDFLLSQSGAIVNTASSANEATQAIEQSLPNVLLSDIGMPEMDGYALIRSIRQTYSDRILPAIALTAYAGEYDRQQALQAGFQQHIPKPIDPETVTNTILALLPP